MRTVRMLVTLAGMVVSLVGAGCGASKPTPPPGLDEEQLAGWRAYVDLDCAKCHGRNREGTRTAPPLTDLDRYWTQDQLVSYLIDPDAMVKTNPHLAYKAEQYAIGMPKVSGKSPGYAGKTDEETLRVLAAYLLVDVPTSENR